MAQTQRIEESRIDKDTMGYTFEDEFFILFSPFDLVLLTTIYSYGEIHEFNRGLHSIRICIASNEDKFKILGTRLKLLEKITKF